MSGKTVRVFTVDNFPAESPKPEAVANKVTGNFIPKSPGAQSVARFRDSSIPFTPGKGVFRHAASSAFGAKRT